MSSDTQHRKAVEQAIMAFDSSSLPANALHLFNTLGYRSERFWDSDLTPDGFIEEFEQGTDFRRDHALVEDWLSVDLLFQLTGDDLVDNSQITLFEADSTRVDNTIIESYLFIAIHLREAQYTRTQLSAITREINKLTPMPAMLIFQHGDTLTLAVINRRLHKRDESRDVLEKVTLIKDIRIAQPHRAHIEILFDLSLERLAKQHTVTNFVELHNAWQKTLDTAELNKRFFQEIANWYFWAVQNATFPDGTGEDESIRNATSIIRLITRLIFVWFIKEKGLVSDDLFSEPRLRDLLLSLEQDESTYYKAILQNLFFATLNQEMNTAQKSDRRKFRGKGRQHYNITNLYRYEPLSRDP